jgi:putative transposase
MRALESFSSIFGHEYFYRHALATSPSPRRGIEHYIQYYNHVRRCSKTRYLAPVVSEHLAAGEARSGLCVY